MTEITTPDSKPVLPVAAVAAILAAHKEACVPDQVSYYPNLGALADTVRSSKCWAEGEVFVWASAPDRFIIMKQVAPSSCEMLTIAPSGAKDVLTAYRFTSNELVAQLQLYLASSEA